MFKKGVLGLCIGIALGVGTKKVYAKKHDVTNSTLLTTNVSEIVVTATRTKTQASEAPGVVEVVSKKDLELKQPLTIDQALSDVPGVLVKRTKGIMDTLASVTLRGIPDQKRTLIMLDGIPLNNPYYGGVDFAGIFSEDLNRIEVVEGPSSSLYGTYAMGGVVNFITKIPKKPVVLLSAGYGSAFKRKEAPDDLRKVFIGAGGDLNNKFGLFISYGREDTNGYPTALVIKSSAPAGTIGAIPTTYIKYGSVAQGYILGDKGDNTYWDDGIFLKTKYKLSKRNEVSLMFLRTRYKYDYDTPHTYLLNATTLQPVYLPSEYDYIGGYGGNTQNVFGATWKSRIGSSVNLKLTTSYFNTDDDWYVLPSWGATFSGGPGKISKNFQQRYYTDLQLSFPVFNSHLLTVGGSFSQDYAHVKESKLSNWKDTSSITALSFECSGKEENYAVFLQDEWMITPKFTVYMGIRADFWKAFDGYVNNVGKPGYPATYPEHSETALSPKFAMIYKLSEKTTLKASIGRAFRAPTIYELYRTWVSSWGTTYQSNPNLNPEYVTSGDLGVIQKLWKGASLEVSGFYNDMKDLIYRKSLGSVKVYVNVGKAVSKGFELKFSQRLEPGLEVFASATYTDSEIKENPADPQSVGKRLTYTPLWMGSLGIKGNYQKFSAYIVGRYVDKMYTDPENKDDVSGVFGSYDSHFVVDLKLGYQINSYAKVNFSVDNVFNKKYYQYYKAPGRSWFAELSLKF